MFQLRMHSFHPNHFLGFCLRFCFKLHSFVGWDVNLLWSWLALAPETNKIVLGGGGGGDDGFILLWSQWSFCIGRYLLSHKLIRLGGWGCGFHWLSVLLAHLKSKNLIRLQTLNFEDKSYALPMYPSAMHLIFLWCPQVVLRFDNFWYNL